MADNKVKAPATAGRARIILVAVLVVLVLALVLVAAKIAMSKKEISVQPIGTIAGTKALIGFSEPDTYATGKGLWLKSGKLLTNQEITAEATAGTPVLEFYYDYTCNFCNDYEQYVSAQMKKLVEGGKAVVVLRPTITHSAQMPFGQYTNNVLYWAAANAPDKVWPLHQAFAGYSTKTYRSQDYEANADNETWKKEATNPAPVVKRLAQENGIDYAKVPQEPTNAGVAAINVFADSRGSEQFGREKGSAGTPMWIANGEIVDVTKFESDPDSLLKIVLRQ